MSDVPEPALGETVHVDDLVFEGPVLDLPDPPAGLDWPEVLDYQQRALLDVNGIDPDDSDAVQAALEHPINVIVAAAASVLGAQGEAGDDVARLMDHSDDHVRVAAAFARAREGDSAGVDTLVELLDLPLGPYITAPEAAGCLSDWGMPEA